jgi:hypothetical protein
MQPLELFEKRLGHPWLLSKDSVFQKNSIGSTITPSPARINEFAMALNAAYALATAVLKDHQSKFSRKDFTGPQLFACLVLREHQKKSYRGVVALLKDCPEWCADIGLKKVPNHNTLCRAHRTLVKPGVVAEMLDVSVRAARKLERAAKKKGAGKS